MSDYYKNNVKAESLDFSHIVIIWFKILFTEAQSRNIYSYSDLVFYTEHKKWCNLYSLLYFVSLVRWKNHFLCSDSTSACKQRSSTCVLFKYSRTIILANIQ